MPKIPFWIFIIIAVLYFSAIRVDTMDIDASQYASISREMLHSANWLHVYDQGHEYLDKPPLLFWLSASSMAIFGENNFGFKFPSILFALLAIYSTYRLARLLYGEETGRMAALLLATCQGMFLMTNDIRCDTLLMSWVITAVWLIKEWDTTRKLKYLFAGFAAVGFGMMTKGPIALMVPVFCFATHWALKRQWKNFFQPAYIPGLVIIALILLPMSIGLYQQFDLHPEKTVNGNRGVSGLRFFYWSQSFGRITGESPWKNDVDLTFLLSNMLWSYLPWIFIFLPAIIINIVQLIRQKFRLKERQEWISTGGFILSYLALGSSGYQLPHYIFVAFPLASVICARSIAAYLSGGEKNGIFKVLKPFIISITGIVLLVVLALIVYVFPGGTFSYILWAVCAGLWLYLLLSKKLGAKVFWLPVTGMIIANIFMTHYFYYPLLKYQVGSVIGKTIRKEKIAASDYISYKVFDPLNALGFYSGEILPGGDTLSLIGNRHYVLTMDQGLKDLQAYGYKYTLLHQGEAFKVSELTPEFINPATRAKAVKKYYLVHIN